MTTCIAEAPLLVLVLVLVLLDTLQEEGMLVPRVNVTHSASSQPLRRLAARVPAPPPDCGYFLSPGQQRPRRLPSPWCP